jgi:hypothetical protein
MLAELQCNKKKEEAENTIEQNEAKSFQNDD